MEEKDELRIATGCGCSCPRFGLSMRWVDHGLPEPPRLEGIKCWDEGDDMNGCSDERGGWLAALSRRDPEPFSVPLEPNLLLRSSSSNCCSCGDMCAILADASREFGGSKSWCTVTRFINLVDLRKRCDPAEEFFEKKGSTSSVPTIQRYKNTEEHGQRIVYSDSPNKMEKPDLV